MPEFLRLMTPEAALQVFLAAFPSPPRPEAESIPAEAALGRILAQTVEAPHALPPFPRSTVDGYALRAADTYGASPALPAYLKLIGEVHMGEQAEIAIGRGEAVLVHTGGMIPPGADAVVMVEDTQPFGDAEIEVLKAAPMGSNVLQLGEDVQLGEQVLPSGIELRAQEIGGLMALGFSQVKVARKPRVGILSTGDEVVPPESQPGPGQVRDVNSYTLSALVERSGGIPVRRGIIPDRYGELQEAVRRAHAEDDLIVVTAGSSVSTRDLTAQVLAELGPPGVLVHGISIRPGKPTILAMAESVPAVGLPGNPVSALVVAGLFVVPAIRRLLGVNSARLRSTRLARMALNISSETGREDYLPVELAESSEGLLAHPVFGRSNLIFTLVRADGLVRIPPEATGLAQGEMVEVELF